MPAKMYYDQDADLGLLKGKTIAVIGYGSQGHAQAQNLRDSGCEVVIGQRPGSANYDAAVRDGFKPVSAADAAAGRRSDQYPLARRGSGRHLHARYQAASATGRPLALLARVQHSLRPGRSARRGRQCACRPQGTRPPGSQRVRQGGRRPVLDRHGRQLHARRARHWPWPMPRASAARARASCRPRSPRRPRPTSSASRSSFAAA